MDRRASWATRRTADACFGYLTDIQAMHLCATGMKEDMPHVVVQ